MEKKFYKTQKVVLDDPTYKDNAFSLDYYVLESNMPASVRKDGGKSYGIEVVKQYVDYFGNRIVQSCDAKGITSSEYEIFALVDKLYEYIVTPMTLREVISDYQCDCNKPQALQAIERGA